MDKSKPREILKSIKPEDREVVIEYLTVYGPTKANTPDLYKQIGKTYKKLEDVFKYLEQKENILVSKKIGRAFYWELKDKNKVLQEISTKDATNLDYAIELSKEEFTKDTVKTLKKMLAADPQLLAKFRLSENLDENHKMNEYYDLIHQAIEERLYIKLLFMYGYPYTRYEEAKPLKMLFMDENWYVAFEYENREKNSKELAFGRLAFLKEVQFLKDSKYSGKKTFQTKELVKYESFLQNDIQNAMSLYGVPKQKAVIKASKAIAKYFDDGMKLFMPSQKFIEKTESGEVLFSLEYTQPLEILPFVQKWMPDLVIQEPHDLKDVYIQKLQQALQSLS